MKKFSVLFLLAIAATTYAGLETAGTIGSPLVNRRDTDKKLVIDARIVDVNGSATGVLGGVSITANSVALNVPASGSTSVLATSPTAQVVNLTHTAGVSKPCVICLASNGGPAAGFKVDFGTSATAPVALTSTGVGFYIAASTTAQCFGPHAPGTHAYFSGVAASSQVIYSVQSVQ